MTTVAELRREVDRRAGRREQIEHDLKSCRKELRHANRNLQKHQQAREVVRTVGLATQQQLEYHFSDIVTAAFEAVFPDPYRLSVQFVERRGKTECDLGFIGADDKVLDPLSSTGGGPVDVASFALRAAAWSMQSPRTRPVLVLDEPFKYLSTDLQPKAGAMLREISERLHMQIVMITHEEELVDAADRVFEVRQRAGVSSVRRA